MRKYLQYPSTIASILVIWYVLTMLLGEIVIASPITVFQTLWLELQTQDFWHHILTSLMRIISALLLALLTGAPAGLYLGLSDRADQLFKPFIYLSYPVPKIVLLPMVMLIFGIGEASKIVILWLILFFQLLITTRDAAKGVTKEAKYSLLSLGGNQWHLYRHVIIPVCLPAVLTALRITTGTVVAVLFFVESIGTNWGLGFYIIDSWGRADIPRIFVGMVVLAVIGIGLYEVFDKLEKTFCRWKQL